MDGVEQLPDTAMRQRLTLQRDDHLVRRRQPVDRQDPERGRTVDQDEVVAVTDLGERKPQRMLTAGTRQEHGLAPRQLDGRRQQIRTVLGPPQHKAGTEPTQQHVVDGQFDGVRIQAQGERQACLRIKVNEQDPASQLAQRGTEARHGRRLGDATLLVCDGEDASHTDQSPSVSAKPQHPTPRQHHRRSGYTALYIGRIMKGHRLLLREAPRRTSLAGHGKHPRRCTHS